MRHTGANRRIRMTNKKIINDNIKGPWEVTVWIYPGKLEKFFEIIEPMKTEIEIELTTIHHLS
jgi:hypothetical protein